ncbi:sel1 repeat family protein [Desulfovibrio sp. OttesenSCG-928-O18]|nr:sel1 repeat family protein [Desulfovibrio sp. OttesenSCG-928-O18]
MTKKPLSRTLCLLTFILLCGAPLTGICAEQSAAPAPSAEEAALRAAAEQGDARAQFDLAVALIRPIPPHAGPIKEGAEAAELLEKSANQGNMDAAFLLGHICQYGTGVPKDVGKSVIWLTKAADSGHVPAMVTLATVYKTADGVMRNKVKARDYYAKAAEKGSNNARAALGAMYMNGDGVAKDGRVALGWLKSAATGGHAPSMLMLGRLYAKKDLGLQNGPKAVYWTHQAVAHGHAPAIYALGLLYRDGVGAMDPDAYKAYLWLKLTYTLAEHASGGDGKTKKEKPYWLENATRALTPEQRKKADAELDVWLKKGPPAPPAKEPQ